MVWLNQWAFMRVGLQLPSRNGRNYSHTFMIADWRVTTRPASYQYYCSGLVSGSHTHTHSHKTWQSAHTLREFFSKFFQHISGSASHESVEERNYRPKAGLNISLSFSVLSYPGVGSVGAAHFMYGVKDGQVCASGGDSSVEWLTSQRTLSDRLFLTIMLS